MSFNLEDFALPLTVMFNKEFGKFIQTVKKWIKFDSETDLEVYPIKDVNGFISEQTLKRKLSDRQIIKATFHPNVHGHFNVVYEDSLTGKKVERHDCVQLFFFAPGYEEHIDEMLDLFQVKKEIVV